MKKFRKAETFSVDQMMQNVASSLVRDFQNNLNDPCYCDEFLRALHTEPIARVRELSPTPTSEMSIAEFKATYQIQSVMKRYRFQNDTYSDEELKSKAITSFMDTQARLAAVDLTCLDAISNRVLDHAARYIAKVLGVYDGELHRDLCRFGRKASVGVPSRLACEAARWELPISGSREQISWFRSEMSEVDCVQNYWTSQIACDPHRSFYRETSSLTLTLVPKTFKSLRAIMPNTTIGSYQSFGLGEMMRKGLKRNGYDIKSLQMRHRYLAKKASRDNDLVTADLSSASDSITRSLVERLFPKDWFEILDQSRIGKVELPLPSSEGPVIIESLTFCTMGIGYTFPLQTLVFLSLLKAIERVTFRGRKRRTISVYGDDLIYPSDMHSNVVRFFEAFGFVINLDKTFHEGHFRESCGGDYYHGVDVRPFQPRNGLVTVGRKAYEAVLYKFVNGLLTRWSEYEIGKTLNYLITEIESVTGKCKLVPGDYPDDSGVKCPTLTTWDFLGRTKCAKPVHVGHGVYRFSYLRHMPDLREEKRHEPYYWLALRGGPSPHHHSDDGEYLFEWSTPTTRLLDDLVGVRPQNSPLIDKEVNPIKSIRSSLTGRRLRQRATYVTVSHTGRYVRQSGISCFGTRR